jgi:hypothetical protein
MFYGKDDVERQFTPLLKKLGEQELFLFEPMPAYKEGDRWTDEFRIRDGHTKLADGSWVTIHKVTTYVEELHKSVTQLYAEKMKTDRELMLARQKNREMEYGLRVAARSLNNSLNLTQDFINNEL